MFTGLLSCKTKLMGSFTQALEAISTNVCTYICVCTQPAAGAVASRASPSHILSSLSRISKDTPAFFDQSVDNSHIACPIIHNCSSKLLSEFVSKASPFFLAAEREMASSSTTNTSDGGAKSSSCPRGHWRPGEDEKLKQLVEKYGPQNWNSIAEKLEGRSGWLVLVSLIVYFL